MYLRKNDWLHDFAKLAALVTLAFSITLPPEKKLCTINIPDEVLYAFPVKNSTASCNTTKLCVKRDLLRTMSNI